MSTNPIGYIDDFESSEGSNQRIVLVHCEKLVKGNATIDVTDHPDAVRAERMPVLTTVNNFSPSRPNSRKTENAQLLPMRLKIPFESASVQLLEALWTTGTLGTVTIQELMSTGKENQVHRKITLTNTYVTNWELLSTLAGSFVVVVLTYSALEVTRSAYDQTQTKQGQVTVGQSMAKDQAYTASS